MAKEWCDIFDMKCDRTFCKNCAMAEEEEEKQADEQEVGRVEGQHEVIKHDDVMHPYTVGCCPKCGEIVQRNQYGYDEECPECRIEMEW